MSPFPSIYAPRKVLKSFVSERMETRSWFFAEARRSLTPPMLTSLTASVREQFSLAMVSVNGQRLHTKMEMCR